jgi:hypothetical protein
MICLRCGNCCKKLLVTIIDDPDKGITAENLTSHIGDGSPCKHLTGDKPGKYSCAIHDQPYYEQTPCFQHSQIESDPTQPCRIGTIWMKEWNAGHWKRFLQKEELHSLAIKEGIVKEGEPLNIEKFKEWLNS